MPFFNLLGTTSSQNEELELKKKRFQITLENFNDSMVRRVSWIPLKFGGINFLTHTLSEDKYGNFSYRVLFRTIVLFLAVLGIEFILLKAFFTVNSTVSALYELGWGILFPFIVLILPTVYSVYKIITFTRRIYFDFQAGYVHLGGIGNSIFNRHTVNRDIQIQEIHAVQILCEKSYFDRLTSSYVKSPYFFFSYEINLILKDTRRVNVLDCGDCEQIRIDAKKIADRLHVPLWDMSSFCDLPISMLPDGQEEVTKS